jgi:hypothetical protein
VASNIDALFVDRVDANYQLAAASPAVNAGASLAFAGASLDAFGIARPEGTAPDAGAFERVTSAAPAATARFTNLSTRAKATPADPVIAGFSITGTGDRHLLVRVVGPTLVSLDVPTGLDDPLIRLYAGSTLLQENDDWSAAANATEVANATHDIGAFELPDGSADAALLTTLAPGNYTVHGVAKDGSLGGVVLVELYDLGGSPAATSRLANVSTRAMAGSGDDTVIAGFILAGGDTPVLVRAIGPGLADFGVADLLADPRLALFQGSDLLAANEQWSLGPDAAGLALLSCQLGAFPLSAGSRDAAFQTILPPGLHTAHAALASEHASGAVVIEVYAP